MQFHKNGLLFLLSLCPQLEPELPHTAHTTCTFLHILEALILSLISSSPSPHFLHFSSSASKHTFVFWGLIVTARDLSMKKTEEISRNLNYHSVPGGVFDELSTWKRKNMSKIMGETWEEIKCVKKFITLSHEMDRS